MPAPPAPCSHPGCTALAPFGTGLDSKHGKMGQKWCWDHWPSNPALRSQEHPAPVTKTESDNETEHTGPDRGDSEGDFFR